VPASQTLPLIGWREWLALPELGVDAIKAKIDTGARTSALHAFDIVTVVQRGRSWVEFKVYPNQRDEREVVEARSRLVEERHVTNSGGARTLRPVIVTPFRFAGELASGSGPSDVEHLIELTLVDRASMGFRMLLGRQAVRGRYLVDPMNGFLRSTHR
jgi:hypothetical protein